MNFDFEETPTTDLFADLTAPQQQAVRHVNGPLLILAGPGSGKTRVITHRIANLLCQGIPGSSIIALTFTNKAADEMRRRVHQLAGEQQVWMGTFHSFCARLLRRYASLVGLDPNYSIYDTDDSRRVLKQALANTKASTDHVTPGGIASAISWAKNGLCGPDDFVPRQSSATGAVAAQVYPEYQRLLREANAVDFDDLLLAIAQLLRENAELRAEWDDRYRYVLVDEYQDTNLAQYAIVRGLSIDHPNLAVTGDPDQSIYGWRGANLSNILEFERDFPDTTIVRLEQNFRSTPNILRAADQLIACNVRRKAKRLYTDRAEGPPVRLVVYPTGRDEADGIAARVAEEIRLGNRGANDFAVFYRINALSRTLEHAFRSAGVPYQVVKGLEFYQRREIKDVLAYLQLVNNPRDNFALLRIINVPPRGLGKVTVGRLVAYAQQQRLSLLEAARHSGMIPTIPARTANKVAALVAAVDRMAVHVPSGVCETLLAVLEQSGYRRWLETSESEEDEERLANIEELLTAAEEFDHEHPEPDQAVEHFLEQSSLVADTDAWEEQAERVTLMTLHAAKGLEFPVVHIIAAEQRLLPHERSMEDPDKLEEERRLLFVGMTRACEELQISLAQYRTFRGDRRPTIPSSFLMELPRQEMAYSEPGEEPDAGVDFSFDVEDFGSETAPPPVWTDAEFFQESPDDYQSSRFASGRSAKRSPGGAPTCRFPPSAFFPGMAVSHPQYGSGMIVAVGGSGNKRRARVQFFDDHQERSFLLVHSPLVPEGMEELLE